jgi:NADH-quinone oxidoreductase subunit G
MSKLITLTIDGKTVQVPSGTLIVDAAKQVGIDIPVFCYHPKMEPVGMCRMCLVDVGRPVVDRASGEVVKNPDGSAKIQFGPKLETACTTPVSEGMVVISNPPLPLGEGRGEGVRAARKEIVEFILTSHPLDCPICDKGGECPLQNLTMAFGPGQSRFLYDEKMHLAKNVPLGELIFLDRERCIQCARCVRFQDEVVDDPVIGFYHRGRSLEIVTHSEPGFDSYFSGNTTDICPVGALTTADFRFGARPWELRATASLCPHCPVGCNIIYNVRREARSGGQVVIKRVMPRQNEAVNEIWICDKGRFAYHYTESRERLTQPLVRKNGELVPSTWDEALDLAAAKLVGEHGMRPELLTLASGRLSNEDLFNLRVLATSAGGTAALYTHMAGGDLVGQVGLGKGTNFADMGAGTTILVVASDLEEEAPIWWLRVKQAARRGATLIVANPRLTKTDRYAQHVLRYTYGQEASIVLAMVNALSAKRPEIPGKVALSAELKTAAEAFAQAENAVVVYGSEGLGLEGSQALAQACANLLITTNHTGRPNNGLLAVWPRANDQGAWDVGFRPSPDLAAAFMDAKVIYLAACDPASDDPALAEALYQSLQAGAFLVVQDLFLTASARLADVILPAQAYTEREGTFTSGERRVQRYYPAVPAGVSAEETSAERGGGIRPKPDYEITALLGKRLGIDLEADFASRVMTRLAAVIPAYAELGTMYPSSNPYRKLAEVTEQWPVVGRGDMYYGGTTYENTQGLGVQLASAVERGELASLSWPDLPPAVQVLPSQLIAVPITLLYDRGQTLLPSELLSARIPKPYGIVSPPDAEKLKLNESSRARIRLGSFETFVEIKQDETLPQGFILVPRSLGIPITGPVNVTISNEVES